MVITNEKRYLILPCDEAAQKQHVKFFEKGKLLLNLDVKLNFENPKYFMHYDLRKFLNCDIEICCDEEKEFEFSDKKEIQKEKIRPAVHFTAGEGWINDPNGLVFYEGKYHMFYQHNPAGRGWANMHWGHAVSEDLINWTEKDIALYPDKLGAMYSGSAVIDKNNLLKLKNGEHDTLVLFYTAAGTDNIIEGGEKDFVQCMAYSTDGAKTFVKYENNPIINNIKKGNRDPKVVYNEKCDCYVMALYAGAGEFVFFKSDNLIKWDKICSYFPKDERECPDIYPLTVGDKQKWVFTGANDYYAVGDFDCEKGFFNVSETQKMGYGRAYASQSFSGLDGRVLRVSWNRFTKIPTKTFASSMSAFCELYLDDACRLCIKPADEIKKAYKKSTAKEICDLTGFKCELEKNPVDITLEISKAESDMSIELFGNSININLKEKTVSVKEFDAEELIMPLETDDEKNIKIRIISDNMGTEIFFKHYFGAFATVNDYDKNYLSLTGKAEKCSIIINEF